MQLLYCLWEEGKMRFDYFSGAVVGLCAAVGLSIAIGVSPFSFSSFGNEAHAATQPEYLQNTPSIELADGVARQEPRVSYVKVPSKKQAAWDAFVKKTPGAWDALWDLDTEQPLRIYGTGILISGSVSSGKIASFAAAKVLENNLNLLAPNSRGSDFKLAANHLSSGPLSPIRTVSFLQYKNGLKVIGSKVNFRFKNDRLVAIGGEAFGNLPAPGSFTASRDRLNASAERWIAESFGPSDISIDSQAGPFVLPIAKLTQTDSQRTPTRSAGALAKLEFRTVVELTVSTKTPIGRWKVYLDSATGEPVARQQLLRFATSTLSFRAPMVRPGGASSSYPASFATVELDGASFTTATTDEDGDFFLSQNDTDATAYLKGPFIQVENDAGDNASHEFTAFSSNNETWSSFSEFTSAQLTTYVHTRIAKEWARVLDPTLEWLANTIVATVNIDEACNAFSDGDTINFYQRSSQCANTGRLSGVIYHEFGHSIHNQAIIPGVGAFDSALSEGSGDFVSATILNDSGVGRGFFNSSAPLREIDPIGSENSWPQDVAGPHHTGKIWGGAMWDLRKALISKYGYQAGVARADELFYAALQRASSIPTTYVEVLVADDNDGNLENGTPNICTIQSIFATHGIANPEGFGGGVSRPIRDGLNVSIGINKPAVACGAVDVVSATLSWKEKDSPSIGGTVSMSFTQGGRTAVIPQPLDGVVTQYQVKLQFANGSKATFPGNPAAPYYEFYTGETKPIYCTSFENDPTSAGWSFGAAANSPNDWQWGEPVGAARGPATAFSGSRIIGTDLTSEGVYSVDAESWAQSPQVNVSGYDSVRLQYRRWLRVEDGQFDTATIFANDEKAWQNLDSDNGDESSTHHLDQEWMSHDVDVTEFVEKGKIDIRFEMKSDAGLEMGGWKIDDFCLIGVGKGPCFDCAQADDDCPDCIEAVCGNGVIDPGETCDDGNLEGGDNCPVDCIDLLVVAKTPTTSAGCQSAGSPSQQFGAYSLLLFALGIALRRRRA